MGLKTEETNGISKLTNQMLKRQGQQPPYFYIPDDAPIAELFGFSKTVDRPSVTKKRKYTKRTPKKATKIEIKNELPGAKQEHDSQNTCIACNIESEIAKVDKTIQHTQPKVYAKQRSRKNKATPVSKRLDSTESPDGVPVIKLQQQQQQQDQREQCISIASGDSDISYYSDFEIQLENTASRYLNSTQS
ncbi:hypothetical protein AX774_g7863 [Zancudomyces culisetae]|uniref:Uncharacterized protein n=1 Tax=Zancudomyces culisetae TaxID=1213189 RepID=A0A1R1PD13_ZANCU|nr:hypothetical protein AX774_g7863 [Zancudomyces culisetae]|eukprot:OMH78742.1 hypothetical protein AX774_g7863 [Zancudomyces culisetae]